MPSCLSFFSVLFFPLLSSRISLSLHDGDGLAFADSNGASLRHGASKTREKCVAWIPARELGSRLVFLCLCASFLPRFCSASLALPPFVRVSVVLLPLLAAACFSALVLSAPVAGSQRQPGVWSSRAWQRGQRRAAVSAFAHLFRVRRRLCRAALRDDHEGEHGEGDRRRVFCRDRAFRGG